jgi:hypothetical protein
MQRTVWTAVWLLATVLRGPSALAQAWVSPAGEGAVLIAAQAIDHTGHILTDGSTLAEGQSQSAAIYLEIDYSFSDRFSMSAGVPFVFAKSIGRPPPFVPVSPVDSCSCWQQDLQDVGLTMRYNLVNGSTAVTSSLAFGVPSHAYAYVGEAVVGRHLMELRVAIDAGTRLSVLSPRLAVQGRYSYAMVERVLDVSTNRSNLGADVLVEVSQKLSVQGTVARQITHGGLRAGTQGPSPPDGIPWGEITTPALLHEHDRLMRDNYWRAGAGLSYGFSRADLFFSYLEFVSGSDTHAGRAFTLGISMPFRR